MVHRQAAVVAPQTRALDLRSRQGTCRAHKSQAGASAAVLSPLPAGIGGTPLVPAGRGPPASARTGGGSRPAATPARTRGNAPGIGGRPPPAVAQRSARSSGTSGSPIKNHARQPRTSKQRQTTRRWRAWRPRSGCGRTITQAQRRAAASSTHHHRQKEAAAVPPVRELHKPPPSSPEGIAPREHTRLHKNTSPTRAHAQQEQ